VGRICGKKRKVLDSLDETSCKGPEEQKVQEIDLRFMGLEVERSVSGLKLKAARGIRGPTASVRSGIFLKKVWWKSGVTNQLKVVVKLLLILAFLYRLALRNSQV